LCQFHTVSKQSGSDDRIGKGVPIGWI